MKNFLVLLLGIFGVNIAYAYTTVNIDKAAYKCNGIRITYSSTESTIQNNCKGYKVRYDQQVISGQSANNTLHQPVGANTTQSDIASLARVKFITDNGTYMKCYYRNGTLYKCKQGKTESEAE